MSRPRSHASTRTQRGDEVLVDGWQYARGRGSGVEISEALYLLWTVRGGKATRLRTFRNRAEALGAAGLWS